MADLRRLPNLLALRTFEAAARYQNFSLAANEIHVTHGAVSHQVRALEKELGVALFTRHGKRLTITTQGARFAQSIRNALEDIAEASQVLRNEHGQNDSLYRPFPHLHLDGWHRALANSLSKTQTLSWSCSQAVN